MRYKEFMREASPKKTKEESMDENKPYGLDDIFVNYDGSKLPDDEYEKIRKGITPEIKKTNNGSYFIAKADKVLDLIDGHWITAKDLIHSSDWQNILSNDINKLKDILSNLDEGLNEKAKSKSQQRFMGMVHAAQKGEKPASPEVAKVAKSMKKKDAEDFAKTKHKGLPDHVGEAQMDVDAIPYFFYDEPAFNLAIEWLDRAGIDYYWGEEDALMVPEKDAGRLEDVLSSHGAEYDNHGHGLGEAEAPNQPMKVSRVSGNKATIGQGIEVDLDQVDVEPDPKNPNNPLQIKAKDAKPGPDPKKQIRPGSQVKIATESLDRLKKNAGL